MISTANQGTVDVVVESGVATISFYHPKANSLPGSLLSDLADKIQKMGAHDDIRVVVLKSGGDKAFCAGASFEEIGRAHV